MMRLRAHHRRLVTAAIVLCVAVIGQGVAARSAIAGWQVVLIAGDNAEPVFDNAVAAMARWLVTEGVPPASIRRFSASPAERDAPTEPATAARILNGIATLAPRPGDRCLVFVTSHGQQGEGVWLANSGEFLRPAVLAQALATGCATVPTVVIVSACYSGAFSSNVMRAPNRIILTAARPDRPSFGCQANRTYTVFDECLLMTLPQSRNWRDVYNENSACVRQREKALGVLPSQPQAFFGKPVRALGLTG